MLETHFATSPPLPPCATLPTIAPQTTLWHGFLRQWMIKTHLTLQDLQDFFCISRPTVAGQAYYTKFWSHIPLPLLDPAVQHVCMCEKKIKNVCFIWSRIHDRVFVVGSCCIKHFLAKQGHVCSLCTEPHRNHNDNLCTPCRIKTGAIPTCASCHKPTRANPTMHGVLCRPCLATKKRDELEKQRRTVKTSFVPSTPSGVCIHCRGKLTNLKFSSCWPCFSRGKQLCRVCQKHWHSTKFARCYSCKTALLHYP